MKNRPRTKEVQDCNLCSSRCSGSSSSAGERTRADSKSVQPPKCSDKRRNSWEIHSSNFLKERGWRNTITRNNVTPTTAWSGGCRPTGAAGLISKSNACIKNAALLSPTDDPPLPEKRLWTESQPGEGRSEAWREKGGSGVRLRLRRGGTLSLPSGTEGP